MNYGIATGAKSGFFAIEVDGPEGKASLEALTHDHGLLPKTVVVKTPRGFHRYFKCPGHPVPSVVSRRGSISASRVLTSSRPAAK